MHTDTDACMNSQTQTDRQCSLQVRVVFFHMIRDVPGFPFRWSRPVGTFSPSSEIARTAVTVTTNSKEDMISMASTYTQSYKWETCGITILISLTNGCSCQADYSKICIPLNGCLSGTVILRYMTSQTSVRHCAVQLYLSVSGISEYKAKLRTRANN